MQSHAVMGTIMALPAGPVGATHRVSLPTLPQNCTKRGLSEPPRFKLPHSARTDGLTLQLATPSGIPSIFNPIVPKEISV